MLYDSFESYMYLKLAHRDVSPLHFKLHYLLPTYLFSLWQKDFDTSCLNGTKLNSNLTKNFSQ